MLTLERCISAFSYSPRMVCAVARLYCIVALALGRSLGDQGYNAPKDKKALEDRYSHVKTVCICIGPSVLH